MSAHAHEAWTVPQSLLAAACGIIGVTVAILGFIDIYLTVTHLLSASWGSWAWTVIVLGEGSGIGAYLGWLLLEMRDDPPRRVRAFIVGYLALFAAGSLILNLAASRGVAGIASHVIVVVAFFGYLVFAKVLVKRLSASRSERALEQALADARQHAIDLCRDRKGARWRWRVPSLLRRQILTGRLPDEVRAAVTLKVSVGQTSGWESAIRAWVFRELRIDLLADAAERQAVASISSGATPAAAVEAALEPAAVAAPKAVPVAAPKAPRAVVPDYSRKIPRGKGRGMSPAQLRPFAESRIKATGKTSKNDLKGWLGVGDEKVAEVLALIEADRRPHLVTAAEG